MAKTSGIVVVALLAILIFGGLATYAIFFRTSQTGFGSQTNPGTSGDGVYISTGSTALTMDAKDSQTGASAPTTSQIRVNNAGTYKTGITTASPNDVLSILLTNASYHAVYIDTHTVPKAPTDVIPAVMKANGTLTVELWNTNDVLLATAGAGTNQTATAGATYNLKMRITGTSQKESTDMICILEAENGTGIQKIELTGFGAEKLARGKPQYYSLLGSTSAVWLYKIKPIVGAETPYGNLIITSYASKSPGATRVKVTCDTMEYHIDPNTGAVAYDIEDSNGNLKSANLPTTNFYFN